MAKRNSVDYPVFSANIVWAAACAAQRLNQRYLKTPEYEEETGKRIEANKTIMRNLITNPSEVTQEDYNNAEVVRNYWLNKLIEVLAGNASRFTSTIVEIAGRNEFKANEWLALGTIAWLPEGYQLAKARDKIKSELEEVTYTSQHLGKPGDKVSWQVTVLESRYSKNWDTYYISAKMENNLVLFAYKKNLEAEQVLNISGTIKAHRENNVTQLNRVRISK